MIDYSRTPTDYSRTPTGDFFESLTKEVRANPLPAALIGMGVLWLFAGGGKTSLIGRAGSIFGAVGHGAKLAGEAAYSGVSHVGSGVASGFGGAVDIASDLGSRTGRVVSDSLESVGETLSGVARRTGEVVSSAYGSASEAVARGADQAASSLREGTGDLTSSADGIVSNVQQGLSHAAYETAPQWANSLQRTVGEAFERQPLLLGALGLAIGAGVAAAIPQTDFENNMVGEASDAAKEQAQELFSAKVQDAKDMADRALKEAQSQGLTAQAAGDLVKGLTDKAMKVADTAKGAIKNELNKPANKG